MLSNQTCYWGVPTPLYEKHRDRESGGGMVPPVGADCYHDTVMFGRRSTQHAGRHHITFTYIEYGYFHYEKKKNVAFFCACLCVCLFWLHQRAASNQLGYCDTSQDKTQLQHHI